MKSSLTVPSSFNRRIVETFGADGSEWLENLPGIVETCSNRWSLTVLPPFEQLSYNYVAPAIHQDGQEVVLKIGVPHPELWTEIDALSLFGGRGIVRLLDVDCDRGAMLLERLKPGMMLVELEDDREVTSIAVQVMKKIWCTPPDHHNFPTVGKWAAGLARLRARFNGGTGPLPIELVEKAESLFSELLDSMDETVLLHGDLHHYNILSAERAPWLALDPKGVVGEAAYEVGALLRNPFPQLLDNPRIEQITTRRVDQLVAELGFDRRRIIDWSIAEAVLSAWWSYEDHGSGWEYGIRCAEVLSSLR